jgi:mutator protein MutT
MHGAAPGKPLIVVAAVIAENGRFLLTRRQAGVHLEHHWEFPGGKVDAGESHADALRRELREELDVDIVVGDLVLSTTHAYADRTVALNFYRCRLSGQPKPALGQDMRWVPRAELAGLQLPPADAELIRLLTSSADR